MDNKESNVICIYNEEGKNIEQILKDTISNLICEDIEKRFGLYETNII